jgi:hypothetical protein
VGVLLIATVRLGALRMCDENPGAERVRTKCEGESGGLTAG